MPYPTAAEIALLRSRQRNFSRVFLGVQRGKERTDTPPSLLVGHHYALTGADTYSAVNYTLTFVANFLNGTDIRNGMTLSVGTLADPTLYGSVRIRRVDVAGNRLCLEQNDLGTLGYLATGDYIWVDGVYRLYRKLPAIVAGVIYEDGADSGGGAGIPGSGVGWNANYADRPVALMGSPRFAWQGESINFYGWRSYARGGAAIASYAWAFDGGIVAGGADVTSAGTPADPVVVTWNAAGEYIASLTVSDNGAGGNDAYGVPYTDHRAVRPVLVYDRPGEGPNPPYTDFEVESLSGKYGSGWTARIKVFGTADKSEFPDNALVILYAEDWYGDTQQSIGGWYGQEEILFCGHIRGDSVQVDFEKSFVTFEAQTIEQWMKDINVWPANFVDAAANEWREFDDMVVEDILWHLAEFSSNLKDITDCFFISNITGEKAVHFLDLTEGSLYDQMSGQIGSCFFGQLSASRQGSVHLFKHKNMMTVAERVAYGVPLLTFTTQDWRDELKVGDERQRDSVAQVDFIGFIYDAGGNPQEVYSLAPLRQLNFGTIEKVTGTLLTGQTIPAAQAENDTLSGLYLAWKNIRFPHLGIPAFNNRVLEPAMQDYFAVNLAVADSIRGYSWIGKEFLTTGMSIDIDNENGIILTNIEAEASTWGPDGVAGEYPPGGVPDGPDPGGGGGPPGYWPEPPPDDPASPGDGNLLYFVDGTSGRVFRTRNARAAAAAVVYEDLGVVDAGGLLYIALDSWDPKNVVMVCGRNGVWKTTNLNDAIPAWTQVLTPTDPPNIRAFSMVVSSQAQQGLWMAAEQYWHDGSGDSVRVHWTTTGGTAWSSSLRTDDAAQPGDARAKVEVSPHAARTAWLVWLHNDGNPKYRKTTDLWASASGGNLLTSNNYWPANPHHRYSNNAADQVGFWAGDGNTQFCSTDMTTCTGGVLDSGSSARALWIGSYTWGTTKYWALTYGKLNGVWGWRFHVSDNGSTWVLQQTFAGDVNFVSGWPYDGERFYATQDGAVAPILISDDRGANWTAQTGNWAALGYNGNIQCCVPVWVI